MMKPKRTILAPLEIPRRALWAKMVDELHGKLKLEQNGGKVWEGAIRLFPNCLSLSLRQLFTA